MIKNTFTAIIVVQIAIASAVVTEVIWVGMNPVVAAEAGSTAILRDEPAPAQTSRQRSSLLVLDAESATAKN
jgi:hypothetical protein